MGKARFGGCTGQFNRECIRKGAAHCRYQSSGCNIRGCDTRRGGHPGYGWELTGGTSSPEKETSFSWGSLLESKGLLASVEGLSLVGNFWK